MKASNITAALRATYKQPEWALFTEVTDGTGAASRRRADAIAMNMWPSRGLEIRAFEVKVSTSDLKSELIDPAKAEAFAQYADSFYLVTPTGLTKGIDIPVTWGVIEVSDTGRVRTVRQATANNNAIEPTREFLAAMLRASAKADESVIKASIENERARLQSSWDQRVQSEVERRIADLKRTDDGVAAIAKRMRDEFNCNPHLLVDSAEFWASVALVQKLGITRNWTGFSRIVKDLDTIQAATNAMRTHIAEYINNPEDIIV